MESNAATVIRLCGPRHLEIDERLLEALLPSRQRAGASISSPPDGAGTSVPSALLDGLDAPDDLDVATNVATAKALA